MKRAALIGTLVLALGGAAMFFLVQDAHMPVLDTAGPIAEGEKQVILITFALSSIIVIPVFFLLFFFAWKYRDTSPQAHVHHHASWDHDNPTAEFLWWLGPTAIIAVLAVVAWQSSHALDPYKPLPGENVLEVQVIALDWKWLFIYPELGIASVNELIIPAGTPVHFVLTADAPMNSFWIPSLGGQIMVMPGMQTQLYLAADTAGVYDGYSGNLSGKGFAGMTFKVRSVSNQAFADWALSVGESDAAILDAETYAALARPSVNEPVRSYASVDSGLYTAVYRKFMAPMQYMQHEQAATPLHRMNHQELSI